MPGLDVVEDYSQNKLDELAETLRSKSSELSQLIYTDHKLPSNIPNFLTNGLDYREAAEDLHEDLEDANEILSSVEPMNEESREEQLYRMYRKNGKIPELPSEGSWRDFYSEEEVLDNERDTNVDSGDTDLIDYRSLLRAQNYATLTLINAAQYDEDLEEYLPDIEGDDAEIIEETVEGHEGSVQPTPVLEHQREGLDSESRKASDHVVFSFLGAVEKDEENEER